jgi:hypothetical protein
MMPSREEPPKESNNVFSYGVELEVEMGVEMEVELEVELGVKGGVKK